MAKNDDYKGRSKSQATKKSGGQQSQQSGGQSGGQQSQASGQKDSKKK